MEGLPFSAHRTSLPVGLGWRNSHGSLELWLSPWVPSSFDQHPCLSFPQSFDQEEMFFDMPFFSNVIRRRLRNNRSCTRQRCTSHRDILSPNSIAIAQGDAPVRLLSSAVRVIARCEEVHRLHPIHRNSQARVCPRASSSIHHRPVGCLVRPRVHVGCQIPQDCPLHLEDQIVNLPSPHQILLFLLPPPSPVSHRHQGPCSQDKASCRIGL